VTDQAVPSSALWIDVIGRDQAPRLYGKRAFDLTFALLCLVLLCPVLLVIAVLVGVSSPGGPLFHQTRLGRYGRPFTIFKFRTMRTGCSDEIHRDYVQNQFRSPTPVPGAEHGYFKIEHDPRVTRFGRLLRRTSLDELPQLFNVIRGDMSLVGPRPALPWEAELFGPAHHARFLLPPGITGLWQVSGRSRLTIRTGLELDLEYVRNRTLLMDLVILLKTIPAVLSAKGAP
jgi:lipopolysaccharide/colanic/teichoic acid biosynthesis glycosyltransferase